MGMEKHSQGYMTHLQQTCRIDASEENDDNDFLPLNEDGAKWMVTMHSNNLRFIAKLSKTLNSY